ncbi:MAG: DUF1343 domain-containing protein [Flavobacteriia bacterium]|nr:DUF1343 domain-containing protein [Flavobacteriia bacterium]
MILGDTRFSFPEVSRNRFAIKNGKFNLFLDSMVKNTFLFLLLLGASLSSCAQNKLLPGAHHFEEYQKQLQDKRVGVVAHHASLIVRPEDTIHLVDFLLENQVQVVKIFGPEHGFRGDAYDGKIIDNDTDPKTGLPVISIYGKNKKPQPEQLQDVDVLIFDLQDVGARFYTYLSTLYLLMEAAAENGLPLIVLDRPNPNGHYVDGPVLDLKYKSFVGMLPIPVVHGMTLGEMAQMINGENWLPNDLQCDLNVIKVSNYDHRIQVTLPVAPSPNLPNAQAVALYPSLCLMEKTVMSIGRGTSIQFQIYGHPDYATKTFQFTPQPNQGSKYPKLEGQVAYGVDLRKVKVADRLDLQWLMDAFTHTKVEGDFFMDSFEILSGTDTLRKQIQAGLSEDAIRDSWKEGLMTFKAKRKNYLLYTDFE